MLLDILLRTHDQGTIHERGDDFKDVAKKEIVTRCARSLAAAIDGIDGVTVTVLDNHSSQETIDLLADLFGTVELLPLDKPAELPDFASAGSSMRRALDIAKESKADAILFLEDDYLWTEGGIAELMETWEKFSVESARPFALCPTDCYDNYGTRNGAPTTIVGGINRRWRTVNHTGFTFMLSPTTLNLHWEMFATFARYWPDLGEEQTINILWRNEVPMLTPMPSLAFHCAYRNPFDDHNALWESFAPPKLRLVKEGQKK